MAIPQPSSDPDAANSLQYLQWANAAAASALGMANQIATHNSRVNASQEVVFQRWAYNMSKVDPVEAGAIKQAMESGATTNDALRLAIAGLLSKMS